MRDLLISFEMFSKTLPIQRAFDKQPEFCEGYSFLQLETVPISTIDYDESILN